MTHPLSSSATRAVVLGGGLSGTLAAAALASHVDEVLILDHDVLPDEPKARRRLPHGDHAHMLWAGGADAMDQLLPGVIQECLDAGAHRIPVPTGMVSYAPAGWFRRSWEPTHYLIGALRQELDLVVRRRVLALPTVFVRSGVKAIGLVGNAAKVRGVRVRNEDQEPETISADLVVDATGRGSKSPIWLEEIGGPRIREITVDAGVRYASRLFKAPAGADKDWPVIHIQADPRDDTPGRVASIISVGGGRWHVSLSGTRGGEPTAEEDQFELFARNARHPLVADALARAEPISSIAVYGRTANRRRFYDRARLPAGFVVLGDAATSLNPVYGHGMSASALGALALRAVADSTSVLSPKFGLNAQRRIARPAADAWLLAVGQDRFYPGSIGAKPSIVDRIAARYVGRLTYTATDSAVVVKSLTDVMTMQKRAGVLFRLRVLVAAARGPRRPVLDAPPLTPFELEILKRAPAERPAAKH
ncbi:FAD-dependent monooxygenase [Streptomyces sp. NBC_01207]|uniref:FAD-dependent monooxygenase n=1 Tax=Streptomyces sp. NBC_01207 TaxID=2903772 RepID=UPI002E11F7C9|nr:pyridine nucleotide-disulfide oxidoreductase [Streptomyces sp. NBC_01207]